MGLSDLLLDFRLNCWGTGLDVAPASSRTTLHNTNYATLGVGARGPLGLVFRVQTGREKQNRSEVAAWAPGIQRLGSLGQTAAIGTHIQLSVQ